VTSKLAAEIRQSKPFASVEEEALLNVVRTSEFLQKRQAAFFKQFQLTPTQYNVLRILRGAGEEGVNCSQISERMLTTDPDITRMLDRLEARNLIQRHRSTRDRRAVIARITASGLALLESIDAPLTELIETQFSRMPKEKLRDLIAALESLREE
jgi:DNA-binding MarR family transcriptional regulator